MDIVKQAQKEVDANYAFFETKLDELQRTHPGKTALLHKQQIIEFYDTENSAYQAGMEKYGEGKFSVQPVDDEIIELGHYSNVLFNPPPENRA